MPPRLSVQRPMLEARSLTKYYSALPAVRDLSFRLAPGGILGLLGPNGSGKSTTVSILTGPARAVGRDGALRRPADPGRPAGLQGAHRLRAGGGGALHLSDRSGVPLAGRRPARHPAAAGCRQDRRLPDAVRAAGRRARADVGVFEGHAAEDPDRRRAAARPRRSSSWTSRTPGSTSRPRWCCAGWCSGSPPRGGWSSTPRTCSRSSSRSPPTC